MCIYTSSLEPLHRYALCSLWNSILCTSNLQNPFKKLNGRVQKVTFHPSKPLFFVAVRFSLVVRQALHHAWMCVDVDTDVC